MKKLKEFTVEAKKHPWITAIIVFLIIGTVMDFFIKSNNNTEVASISDTIINIPQPVTKQTTKPLIDRTDAYVIAKQFAKTHLGSADYGWGDDGFEDNGDGTYYVTGVADIPGQHIRWTVELKYNGGDKWDIRNWHENGWFAK